MISHESSELNEFICARVLYSYFIKVVFLHNKPSIYSMEPVLRFDFFGNEYLYIWSECVELMTRARWLPFLGKFSGFNIKSTTAFSSTFDGNISLIGDVELKITEEFVSQAT